MEVKLGLTEEEGELELWWSVSFDQPWRLAKWQTKLKLWWSVSFSMERTESLREKALVRREVRTQSLREREMNKIMKSKFASLCTVYSINPN